MYSPEEIHHLAGAIQTGNPEKLKPFRKKFCKTGIPEDKRLPIWLMLLGDDRKREILGEFMKFTSKPHESESTFEKIKYEIEETVQDAGIQLKCADAVFFLSSRYDLTSGDTSIMCKTCAALTYLNPAPMKGEVILFLDALLRGHIMLLLKDKTRAAVNDQFFYLLLRYHMPSLSVLVDELKIPLMDVLNDWTKELFLPVVSDTQARLFLWDVIFSRAAPGYHHMICLALLSSHIEELKASAKSVGDFLVTLTSMRLMESIESVIEKANDFWRNTPLTIMESIRQFHAGTLTRRSAGIYLKIMFAPVSMREAHDSMKESEHIRTPKFLVLDCRPAEAFALGHLAHAKHVDAMKTVEKGNIAEEISRILAEDDEDYGKEPHVVFSSDGEGGEADQMMNILLLTMLKEGHKHLSISYGGFKEAHRIYHNGIIMLVGHASETCPYCRHGATDKLGDWEFESSSSERGIFNMMSTTVLKNKIPRMLPRFGGKSKGESAAGNGHSSGKKVFTIDDKELASGSQKTEKGSAIFRKGGPFPGIKAYLKSFGGSTEWSNIDSWLNHKDIRVFPTNLYNEGGELAKCFVVITNKSILCLLCKPSNPQLYTQYSIHPLSRIAKIVCRERNNLRLVIFTFLDENDERVIERYCMPNNLVVNVIKENIQKLKKEAADVAVATEKTDEKMEEKKEIITDERVEATPEDVKVVQDVDVPANVDDAARVKEPIAAGTSLVQDSNSPKVLNLEVLTIQHDGVDDDSEEDDDMDNFTLE